MYVNANTYKLKNRKLKTGTRSIAYRDVHHVGRLVDVLAALEQIYSNLHANSLLHHTICNCYATFELENEMREKRTRSRCSQLIVMCV